MNTAPSFAQTAGQAAKIVAQGGKHWSAPAELTGIAGPQPGEHVYLWPQEDCVYELQHKDGKFSTVIALKWLRAANTKLPQSKVKNVKTHIFYHRWKGATSTAFGSTTSIIDATSNTGTLNFSVKSDGPWDGVRELEFRVMTNDRPAEPVANFLRLQVRAN